MQNFDVVIVGAATSGSTCAYRMAKNGLKVALLESKHLDEAGYSHLNNIPPGMFDDAGVPMPESPENRGAFGIPAKFLSTDGKVQVSLGPNPVISVDMRMLTDRLHLLAQNAGVEIFDRIKIQSLEFEGVRPCLLKTERSLDGGVEQIDFKASLFVDASGLNGALRRRHPELSLMAKKVDKNHLCTASMEVCKVSDKAGALRYLESINCKLDESINRIGTNGGFSIMAVRVGEDLKEVDLLCGAIADGKRIDGPGMVKAFKEQEPWVGETLQVDSGLIPLRRPYDVFTMPGIALLGDAACQVFCAHGSGTGIGMVAGRMLADAVCGANDPGDWETLWKYQSGFQRSYGAVHGSYDVFRRLSQSSNVEQLNKLVSSGLMSEEASNAGFRQDMPVMSVKDGFMTGVAALKSPLVTARALPALARMGAAFSLYKLYPQKPDMTALARWSKAIAKVYSDEPDVN